MAISNSYKNSNNVFVINCNVFLNSREGVVVVAVVAAVDNSNVAAVVFTAVAAIVAAAFAVAVNDAAESPCC